MGIGDPDQPVNVSEKHPRRISRFGDMATLGDPIDLLTFFRNSTAAGDADAAIAVGAKAGLDAIRRHAAAAARAEAAGLML
jgi:hypothetical protein